MNWRISTKPFLLGVVAGAVAWSAIGFSWFGRGFDWHTGGTVKAKVEDAVIAAMAPVCAEQFLLLGPETTAKYRAATYNRDGVVREHIKTVGLLEVNYALARACADAIDKRFVASK